MGVLSALGKIGKGALKVGSWLPIPGANYLGKASDVADKMGAVGDVAGEAGGALHANRLEESAMRTRMNEGNNRSALDAAGFNRDTEGALMRRALASKMIGGLQPPSDPRARFGGGQVTPEMAEMFARFGDKADQDVTSGSYRVSPQMSEIPKSGALEKIMGGVGVGSSILSALGKIGGSADIGASDYAKGGTPGLKGASTGGDPYAGIPASRRRPLGEFVDDDFLPPLQARRNVPPTGRLA